MKNNFHQNLYSYCKYYDIAFDFKDIKSECDFFEVCLQKYTSPSFQKTFLELAAGPALHAIQMCHRGYQSTAVDLSKNMKNYVSDKVKGLTLNLDYQCLNMVDFKLDQKFSLAAILMDSTSYILSNQDMIQHLKCVASVLEDQGLYILEMAHPSNLFSTQKTTTNDWEMESNGCKVSLTWGSPNDVFNPITQITETSIKLSFDDQGVTGTLSEQAPQRCYTATEFESLVLLSGVFEIAGTFGAMKMGVPFSNEKESWRMILVLRKK